MNISTKYLEKVTTNLTKDPVWMLDTFCIGPLKNPLENDFYNDNINKIFEDNDAIIEENDFIQFKDGEKGKCLYFNKLCIVDYALDFTDIKTLSDERLFLVANIRCEEDKKVFLRFSGSNARIKLWVNNILIFNGYMILRDLEFSLIELSKGDNVVFVELSRILTDIDILKFSVQAQEYIHELVGREGEIMKAFIDRNLLNKVQIVQDCCNLERRMHEFIVMPKDFINKPGTDQLIITVKDSSGYIYDKLFAKMQEKINCNLDNIVSRMVNDNFLLIEIEYETVSGKKVVIVNTLLIGDAQNQLDMIKAKYDCIADRFQLGSEDKASIQRKIKDIENIIIQEFPTWRLIIQPLEFLRKEIKGILDIFKNIEMGSHCSDLAYISKVNKIYYKSKLDEQEERISILLPQNYMKAKKYPLVIVLPNERYDDEGIISQSEYKDVIIAEISCKGMTFGSYIGEASFLEGLQIIMNSYTIDEDRIYLFGICSGAYAAWLLSQAYPSLFAAIAISNGAMYEKNMLNLSNIKILNICAEMEADLEKFYKIPSKLAEKFNTFYQGALFKGTTQHTLNFFLNRSDYILEWLLQHKREKYPQKIFYRTERLRHNKTYWAQIQEIEEGKKYCKFEGEMLDDFQIRLSLNNVGKFNITIPDSFNNEFVTVEINENQIFSLENIQNDKLYFEKSENGYSLVNEIVENVNNSNFGMGIVGIYMDSLKLVIPSKYNSEKEESIIKNIASTYSNPITSGVNPKIYINYPVIESSLISANDIQFCNLILIGQVYDDLLLEIKDKLPLKFDETGYEYKGIRCKGDYCIIMICSNPININKKLLYIYANNYKLLRNIYTRKAIIPTYFNGMHPFLNSEAIIFDGREYYVINAIGDNIQRGF